MKGVSARNLGEFVEYFVTGCTHLTLIPVISQRQTTKRLPLYLASRERRKFIPTALLPRVGWSVVDLVM